MRLPLILFHVFFLIPYCLVGNKDPETLTIIEKKQELDFKMSKKGEITAELRVTKTIISNSALERKYVKTVFLDEHSQLKNVYKKVNKKRKSIEPVYSDYEMDGIFHSDVEVCYLSHNFSELYEVITLSYSKIFYDLKFLNKLYFSDAYEVEASTITIEVPDWLNLDLKEWNVTPEMERKVDKEKSSKLIQYTAQNLQPLRKYRNEPSAMKSQAHLIPILKSVNRKGRAQRLMEETSDLYGWYSSLVKEIGNDTDTLQSIVDEITVGKENDLDKVKSIFYWVQDNIRYLAFEEGIMGFRPEACQLVYRNKYGDCKGMANLTKEMLKIAGFDARLTWLGTRDIPYDYSMPSLQVDNHMICTVVLDDEYYFLDATEKNNDFGVYAFRIQGKEVMIEDGDDFILKKVPEIALEDNNEHYSYELDLVDDKISGKGSVIMKGNRKSFIHSYLKLYAIRDQVEELEKYFDNGDKNIQVKLSSAIELGRDTHFSSDFDVTMDNHVINLGDEIYFSPEFDYTLQKYVIPKERDRSLDLSDTYMIGGKMLINIPSGYTVDYLPEEIEVENDKYAMHLSYQKVGNQISYNKTIRIKKAIIEVSEFGKWNEDIERLGAFYSDQVILKKK